MTHNHSQASTRCDSQALIALLLQGGWQVMISRYGEERHGTWHEREGDAWAGAKELFEQLTADTAARQAFCRIVLSCLVSGANVTAQPGCRSDHSPELSDTSDHSPELSDTTEPSSTCSEVEAGTAARQAFCSGVLSRHLCALHSDIEAGFHRHCPVGY